MGSRQISEALRAGTFPARLLPKNEGQKLLAAYGDSMPGHFEAVDLDSTFQFECVRCGYCCYDRHEQSNYLTGHDVASLAQGLGTSSTAVLARLTQFAPLGMGNSRLGFRLVAEKVCPFWQRDKTCAVQSFKPIICALAPLGFVIDAAAGAFTLTYQRNRPCPGVHVGPRHSVADWLDGLSYNAVAAFLEQEMLNKRIVQLYRDHYPQQDVRQVLVAHGMITMVEELLYDTTHLAEALSMPIHLFNQMLTMPLTERYQIGLQMAKETVAELEQTRAAGDPFPEHFRPNGYDH